MRFLMMTVFVSLVFGYELPKKPQAYEKDSSKKIEISGEILLRYDKQITSDKNLIRPKNGSEGSLNISIQ